MSNKKKRAKQKSNDLITTSASVHKLHSVLASPEVLGYLQSGMFQGVREKLLRVNFQTIRNVVDRIPLVNAIIGLRTDQALPFCRYTQNDNEVGYSFERTDGKQWSEKDDKVAQKLVDFFDQTGFHHDSDREDDLTDYVGLLIRETLTIDQIATELQRNRKGEVAAFWLLDGSFIKRVDPKLSTFDKKVKFVQQIETKMYNKYTDDDLLFDYKNKRADLRFRGFGYSSCEQCIDLITTLLFGYNYIRDQLLRDRVPKGFISVMGDVGQPQLDSIRRYWYAAMSGAGGQWNIPILPSGKEGVGMEFKHLGFSNKDMEYHKLMMFISSAVGAVFGIDLAELGIKTDDSTSLIGENTEPRIQASKDRGLTALLFFIGQHLNKILRKITTDYRFKFVGIVRENEKVKWDVNRAKLETAYTINEIREDEGDEPIDEAYADVVLNPQAVQIYQQDRQNEQQAKQAEMGGGMPGGEGAPGEAGEPGAEGGEPAGEEGGAPGQEEEPGNEKVPPIDWSNFQKSRGDDKTIRIVIGESDEQHY